MPLNRGVLASCHKAKAIKKNIFCCDWIYFLDYPVPSFLICPPWGRGALVGPENLWESMADFKHRGLDWTPATQRGPHGSFP